MPVLTVYQHGLKAGIAPAPSDHQRGARTACKGWSSKTTRSNTEFLRSVALDGLDGLGFAFTLTVRHCPPMHEDWAKLRKRYLMRLTRAGAIRVHWVTEWQRRGVPHLHGCVFFPTPRTGAEFAACSRAIEEGWLEAAAEYDPSPVSQTAKLIADQLGWLKYLAKHASRGANHYQRSAEGIPPGWMITGRMWGQGGSWPTVEPDRLSLTNRQYWLLRRIVRGWRVADARADHDQVKAKRIRSARRLLRCPDRRRSEVRGVSEWIPCEDMHLAIVHLVRASGEAVADAADLDGTRELLGGDEAE